MTLKDWVSAAPTSPPLTRELFDRYWEQLKNAPPDPCRLGRHVVSATALREGWEWATCANCYRPVRLRAPE